MNVSINERTSRTLSMSPCIEYVCVYMYKTLSRSED